MHRHSSMENIVRAHSVEAGARVGLAEWDFAHLDAEAI